MPQKKKREKQVCLRASEMKNFSQHYSVNTL